MACTLAITARFGLCVVKAKDQRAVEDMTGVLLRPTGGVYVIRIVVSLVGSISRLLTRDLCHRSDRVARQPSTGIRHPPMHI